MQMLHQMREAGHAPELLTYGNVMSACARNGRVSTVRRAQSRRNFGAVSAQFGAIL